MNPIDLLGPWKYLAYAAIAAALIGGATYGVHRYNDGLREEGRAQVQAKWDADREAQKDAALRQAAANAQETQRRLLAQKEAQDAHDKDVAAARAAAARAAAAAASLRQQLTAFTAAAGRTTGHPAAAGDGPPAADALDLLAQLFSRADDEAGVLAEALDASHAAGQQCERAYDTLAPKE
jgi:hypothetical protein